jgi:hypothetical protein
MIRSTIMQHATQEEINFLLAFEASEQDSLLKSKRDEAYLFQDFSLATKLERISSHAQARLNRRYLALQIH